MALVWQSIDLADDTDAAWCNADPGHLVDAFGELRRQDLPRS